MRAGFEVLDGPMGAERDEAMIDQKYEVTKIADGLGIGEGDISAVALREKYGDEPFQAMEALINDVAQIMKPIDVDSSGQMIDDDGCGDGRGVGLIYQGLKEIFKKSKNRAKVFGGGATMTMAILVGSGKAQGRSIEQTFGDAINTLEENDIAYGAHTADHVAAGREDIDSGCGAIDKAPQIWANAIKYRSQIHDTMRVLGIDDEDAIKSTYANIESYAEEVRQQPYAGKKVMGSIAKAGRVIKQLVGQHVEAAIVLDMVPGHTVDQIAVRTATKGKLDVFAVDVWRMQSYAEKLCPNDEGAQARAFISQLIYTLATAATLTKGDLPVYKIDAVTPSLEA